MPLYVSAPVRGRFSPLWSPHACPHFIPGTAAGCIFAQVPVSLLVASITSKMAWGRVPAEELCSNRLSSVHLIVGIGTSVPFTACDYEELPVVHGLPSPRDDRRFTAFLDSDGRLLFPAYVGQGIYEAAVQVSTHGTHSLRVELDSDTAVGILSMQAACPEVGQTVPLPAGATFRC